MELEEILAEKKGPRENEFADFLTDPNIYCLLIYALMLCFMFWGCDSQEEHSKRDLPGFQGNGNLLKSKKEQY